MAADDGGAYDIYMEEIAAVMALMDSLQDGGRPVGGDPVRVGAWHVYAPDHNGRGYPMALVIVPDPAADDSEVFYGITAGVLQKIRIAELRERYAEQIAPALEIRDRLARYTRAARDRRRDDVYYAIASDAYASLTDAGDTAPLRTMADAAGLPVGTVRTQLRTARKRGMLTGTHGRAGGTLTDHAKELLGQMEAHVQQPIVAAIVTSDRRVLVGRRNDRRPPWTFIAGEVEPGELPADAAEREVKEETGLEVRAGHVIGERDHPATGRHMIYMAGRPVRGTEVFVGDEAELAEVRWVSLAEADELLPGMFEPVREYLARKLGEAGDNG